MASTGPLDAADPVQGVAGAAPMSGGGLLYSLSAHGELVGGQMDDVERVHHRPCLGDGFGGGGVVSGEPVHRHHLDAVSKHLVTGIEPLGEHLR